MSCAEMRCDQRPYAAVASSATHSGPGPNTMQGNPVRNGVQPLTGNPASPIDQNSRPATMVQG